MIVVLGLYVAAVTLTASPRIAAPDPWKLVEATRYCDAWYMLDKRATKMTWFKQCCGSHPSFNDAPDIATEEAFCRYTPMLGQSRSEIPE